MGGYSRFDSGVINSWISHICTGGRCARYVSGSLRFVPRAFMAARANPRDFGWQKQREIANHSGRCLLIVNFQLNLYDCNSGQIKKYKNFVRRLSTRSFCENCDPFSSKVGLDFDKLSCWKFTNSWNKNFSKSPRNFP